MDIQRTAPARSQAPPIAGPVSGDPRLTFYELASAAITAGRLSIEKFNSLVDKASRLSFEDSLLELRACLA